MTPNAQHKRAERRRRRDAGEVRCEFWMTPEMVSNLDHCRHWHDRTLTPTQALEYALRIAVNES